MEYYGAITLLLAIVAVMFWKLGYSRGMLAALEQQTAQEQMRMWTQFYSQEEEDEEA